MDALRDDGAQKLSQRRPFQSVLTALFKALLPSLGQNIPERSIESIFKSSAAGEKLGPDYTTNPHRRDPKSETSRDERKEIEKRPEAESLGPFPAPPRRPAPPKRG